MAAKKKDAGFLPCIRAGFDEVGTKGLKSKTKIVWAAYSEEDVRAVATVIEKCLEKKGHACPPLGGAFNRLREDKRVTLVSEFVQALVDVCA